MTQEEKINSRLILIYMIICISVFQSGVDYQMSMFMYYTPKYQCQLSNGSGVLVTADNCFYYANVPFPQKQDCQNWTFDTSQIRSTMVTDMLLICKEKYRQLILSPLRNLSGMFVIFLGLLSDICGRRIVYIICCFTDTLIWVLLGVTHSNYIAHVILRFLKLFGIGSSIIGFVLVSELTPAKYRNFIVINYWTFFSIGLVVAPVYVKYISTWYYAWIVAFWPMCFNIFVPFILLESPKWLISNNRKEEAIIILKKLDQNISNKDEDYIPRNGDADQVKEMKAFCSSGKLMGRLGVLLLLSWSFFLVYEGTSTNLQFSVSNIYINAVIMGLIEIPAGPLGYLSNKYIGGVTSVVAWTFVGMVSFLIIPDNWDPSLAGSALGIMFRVVLAGFAKFCMILAWNVSNAFYIYLMPTNKRNAITNMSETVGFFGGAVGGFIGYYYRNAGVNNNTSSLSNVIYGTILAITVTIFGLVIPSIKNIELPNTVEEAEQIEKGHYCTSKKGFD